MLAVLCVVAVVRTSQAQAGTDAIGTAKKNTVSGGTWQVKNGRLMYKTASGSYLKKTWARIDGTIYRFSYRGYVRTGWFKVSGSWYYAKANGSIQYYKFVTVGGRTYYLRANGTRASFCFVKRNGKYYWLSRYGYLRRSCVITYQGSKYYIGSDGARYANRYVTVKGVKYYCGSDGRMVKTGTATQTLFVGDSRTEGMRLTVGSSAANTVWVAKVGAGYSWLKSTADAKVRSYLAKNPTMTVVFAFGVNDLGNISSYIAYYKNLIKAYPNAHFYFTSVNPVVDARSRYAKNSAIQTFNNKLAAAVGTRYIGTYAYLVNNGYTTVDGLHYTTATYKKIYNYIKSAIS